LTISQISSSHIRKIPNSVRRNELLLRPYAAVDLEYRYNEKYTDKPYSIFAAAIVDSLGNVKSRHESDFADYHHPENLFFFFIMNELLQYKLTIGWYTKGVRI